MRVEMEQLVQRTADYMNEMKDILNDTKSDSIALKEEGYTSLCDGLVVFCDQLALNPWMESLVYTPSPELQEDLNRFMQENVFSDEKDEDLDEHARIELLHKRRNFLAQYCKLVVYNILPTRAASDVFKHYVRV